MSIAFDNKKSIIPFKIHDFEFTDEYLYFLGRKHWIEAHGNINAGLEVLKNTVLSLMGPEAAAEEKGKQMRLFRQNTLRLLKQTSVRRLLFFKGIILLS